MVWGRPQGVRGAHRTAAWRGVLGWAPPGSEMREEWGRAGWAGTGNGPAVWAAGEGKEKGEEGDFGPWERKEMEGRRGKRWAGWAERERGKERLFYF